MFIIGIMIFSLIISNCSNPSKTNNETHGISKGSLIIDSVSVPKDSIMIYSDEFDTIKYPQSELNLITRNYPVLVDTIPSDPNEAYVMSGCSSDKKGYRFGSEAGQDEFFVLYGYFLKLKNGEKKYQIQRERLIKIYRTINDIYGYLNYGGTYFGHQYKRITGFVEYSIYSLINNDGYYKRMYNFTKQKKLYILSFKQLIEDELSVDNETFGDDKKIKKIEILDKLRKLDSLILDFSDLKCAQKFQYSNY